MSRDPQPEFVENRHLTLAVLALLAYLVITELGWAPLMLLGVHEPWTQSALTLRRSLHLLVVAVPTWLAFAGLDTRAGVELVGTRWRRAGWLVGGLCVGFLAAQLFVYWFAPDEVLRSLAGFYRPFRRSGQTSWGWLISYFAVSALTEELLFRGLIQRALEGYLELPYAVAIQALLFELVHVLHGAAPTGGFFFGGLVFGLAFARTRSLGLAFLLHLGANSIHAALFTSS